MPAAALCRTCVPVYARYSTCTRACASTDCFLVRAANRELYRGNENSSVRWAVPTPQMYSSVGGLTCIYETRVRVCARARQSTHSSYRHVHYIHVHACIEERRRVYARAYKPRRRLVPCRSTCHSSPSVPNTPFCDSLYPHALSKTSLRRLFRGPIQSSASYDLCLVIPSV